MSNAFGIIYADGSDECFNLSSTVSISTLQINGEAVTSSAAELNVLTEYPQRLQHQNLVYWTV